ncbi:copper fist DNA binding domain-containing protein [Aspergillus germanicus]
MPFDEHGNKWSCDPCLRGHRSSKCKHFDRLMAKVQKSGRPSKKCPHAKRNCGCRKSYAVMAPLSYDALDSNTLCRPVYYVSRSPDEPHTPEPYSPNLLDNWHNMLESDFCPQPPHIPDVFDIISQTPKSPAEDSPPVYVPAALNSPMSMTSYTHPPPGLGIDLLSGSDLAMSYLNDNDTPFIQEYPLQNDTRAPSELEHDMSQSGHREPNNRLITNLPGWPTSFAVAP